MRGSQTILEGLSCKFDDSNENQQPGLPHQFSICNRITNERAHFSFLAIDAESSDEGDESYLAKIDSLVILPSYSYLKIKEFLQSLMDRHQGAWVDVTRHFRAIFQWRMSPGSPLSNPKPPAIVSIMTSEGELAKAPFKNKQVFNFYTHIDLRFEKPKRIETFSLRITSLKSLRLCVKESDSIVFGKMFITPSFECNSVANTLQQALATVSTGVSDSELSAYRSLLRWEYEELSGSGALTDLV